MRTFRERRESKKVKRIIPRRDLKDRRKKGANYQELSKKAGKKKFDLRPALSSLFLFRE